MNIVIRRIVAKQDLEWVPRDRITAVVVDRFEGGDDEESGRLAGGHSRQALGQGSAKTVKKKTLKPVVVERTKRIWHVESVVN